MEGTVKWYNEVKSFGFIEIEEGKDVFVHRGQIEDGVVLKESDRGQFEVEDAPKGPQATNVKKL